MSLKLSTLLLLFGFVALAVAVPLADTEDKAELAEPIADDPEKPQAPLTEAVLEKPEDEETEPKNEIPEEESASDESEDESQDDNDDEGTEDQEEPEADDIEEQPENEVEVKEEDENDKRRGLKRYKVYCISLKPRRRCFLRKYCRGSLRRGGQCCSVTRKCRFYRRKCKSCSYRRYCRKVCSRQKVCSGYRNVCKIYNRRRFCFRKRHCYYRGLRRCRRVCRPRCSGWRYH